VTRRRARHPIRSIEWVVGGVVLVAVGATVGISPGRFGLLGIVALAAGIGAALALRPGGSLGGERGPSSSLVLSMVVVWFLVPWSGVHPIGTIELADIVLVVVCLPLLAISASRRTRPFTAALRTPVLLGMLLATMGGISGALVGPNASEAMAGLLRLVVGIGLPLLVIVRWRPNERERATILAAYVAGASVSVLYGLVGPRSPNGRVVGLAFHPNDLGLICVMALPMTFRLWVTGRTALTRALAACGAAVLVVGVLASGSRGALLGMAVIAVVMLSRVTGTIWSAAPLAVIIGTVIVALALTLTANDSESALARARGTATTAKSDQDHRKNLTEGTHRIAQAPITGTGFTQDNAKSIHNPLLQFVASAGLLGGAGYVLITGPLLAPALGALSRTSRYRSPAPVLFDTWVLSLVQLGYVVTALFAFQVWFRSITLPVALLASLLLDAGGIDGRPEATPALRRGERRAARQPRS
jgi:hypothetical protein